MPTVLLIKGYRFFFFSNERNEPIHIHIEKAEKYAKFWIDPLFVAINYGLIAYAGLTDYTFSRPYSLFILCVLKIFYIHRALDYRQGWQ